MLRSRHLESGLLLPLALSASSFGMAQELKPCPDKPNCVSSLSTDAQHATPPLVYSDTQQQARARLMAVMQSMPRTKLLLEQGDYLHFSATSLVFRFVDDVEFVFDDTNKRIHVRSASRVGHSDLGVNRKRVNTIREAFAARL